MKKKVILLSTVLLLIYALVFLIIAGCNPGIERHTSDQPDSGHDEKYQLVWQDEFNYTGLPDTARWTYDVEGNEAGWGNNESQWYTIANEKNAHVEKGALNIIAKKEDFKGKKFTSARLVSKADWKYGKIEVSAKIPAGRGTWSAIWMMPEDWSFNDGNWPDIGELDIMEHVGHNLGIVHASAHSKDYQWQKNTQKTDTIFVSDVSEEFHSYILEWTPDVLKAFVDDSLYFEYKNEGLGETKWPYDKPFHLIMNIAVGGAWGSIEGIDEDAFPQTMEINYVRVYQLERPSEIE